MSDGRPRRTVEGAIAPPVPGDELSSKPRHLRRSVTIGDDTLSAAQMREARRIVRDRQSKARADRAFGERLVVTLTEGQNALNIAFGAILSAYIGTVLAAIDDKPFSEASLATFFVLIGVFIGGLCIGNAVVLRRHFGLGAIFLTVSAIAAFASLRAAQTLGFELPILKVMYVCWFAMLVVTDAVLTAIVFLHHHSIG